jgi:hypothetical protein
MEIKFMFKKPKGVAQTQEIFYSIANYCEENPHIKFWAQKKNLDYRVYIGDDSEFNLQKNTTGIFDEIFEITKDNIFSKCNEINITKNIYRTQIQTTQKFHINFNKEYNEIYAEVFWNNEHGTTLIFANQYLTRGSLSLGTLLKYKKYPNVFSDLTSSPKIIHNDWVKLLTSIPNEKFRLMWKNLNVLNDFHETLKEIKINNPEIKPHLFLINSLKLVLRSMELMNDSQLKISYMLFDILPKNLIKKYINNFPLLESLINKKDDEIFFKQEENEIIEKLALEESEIYLYFRRDDLKAHEYLHLTEKIFNLISNNEKLKENGLISTDFLKDKTINFYMSLNRNDVINKNLIKDVFVDAMNSFINNPEMIEQRAGSITLFNNDLLVLTTNKTIDRLLLEKELKQNTSEKRMKRKV